MRRFNSRGDISVYIALMLVTAMLGTALAMQLVISRQMRYTASVPSSERALYAASAGLEAMLAALPNRQIEAIGQGICHQGEIPYPGEDSAQFESWGMFVAGSSEFCVYSQGTYQGANRYFSTGREDCVQELITQSLNSACE